MPPEQNSEFDIHINESMQRLQDLRSNFSTDIFISVCPANIPKTAQQDPNGISPLEVISRIKEEGYKW